MANVKNILDNWATERDNDWYAVDMLNDRGEMRRLLVANYDECARFAADRVTGAGLVDYEGNPAEPGWNGAAPFYRVAIIHERAAYDAFAGCLMDGLQDDGRMLTMSEAAKVMGISRQAVHGLIKRGSIYAELWSGEYRINTASCILYRRSDDAAFAQVTA